MRGIDVSVYRPADHKPEPEGPVVADPDPDYEGWTDEDVAALVEKAGAEHKRRQVAARAAETVTRAAEEYRAATGIRDGSAWRQPTGAHDAVPPGQTRVFPDGTKRRNVSGIPLAHGPDEYPQGWETIEEDAEPTEPDPDEHPEWAPDIDYAAGDVVSHDGDVYEAVQGHRSQAGWEPPAVPALWSPV